ncbi:MAG: FKBP-type peptidyl-prolyl cis-trans isomerase [Elusimicrobiota bacterium]
MKLTLLSLALIAAAASAADAPKAAAQHAPSAAASKEPFKTDDERAMYTIGFLMGRNVATFNMSPAEAKIIQSGLGDAILGKQPKVDLRLYQPRVNDILAKRLEAVAGAEKEKGRVFTEKFVKESKPQAIPGGGWYLETRAGTGPMPAKTDTIKAHYRGTFIDGGEFDSSYERGAPSEFSLAPGGVIDCWSNGIPMMKVGAKAKLVCPSDVAYKDQGRPGIKPGATLIFEVELVDIVKPEAPKQ